MKSKRIKAEEIDNLSLKEKENEEVLEEIKGSDLLGRNFHYKFVTKLIQ